MHLLLCNVVPNLWRLLNRALKTNPAHPQLENYVLTAAALGELGKEYSAAFKKVPERQTWRLRNIRIHSKSFKAVK